jgi:selenophosphate synthetase-related protein
MDIEGLLSELRGYEGMKRKESIGRWSRPFLGAPQARPGDNAGAVVLGDGFLLLSGEGIWPALPEDL